jgi:uncharacterized protein
MAAPAATVTSRVGKGGLVVIATAASVPPQPVPSARTAFFWQGVDEGQLRILRCEDCGWYVHYPRPICTRCQGARLSPSPVSGRGALYAYTTVMQAFHPYFVDKLPYVLAVVELDEQPGLRLTTNLVDHDGVDLRVGLRVEVVFREVGEGGAVLPLFRPVAQAEEVR